MEENIKKKKRKPHIETFLSYTKILAVNKFIFMISFNSSGVTQ